MDEHIGSLHIVRRYGPVGGMERYVWELTHALHALAQPVTIICEKAHAEAAAGIRVIELGEIKPKPRWVSMLRFSANVSRYLQQHPELRNNVIHSHERSAEHQVTTFHGPPIKDRKASWLDILSPRIQTWLHLEQRELLADNVQAVLPNSDLIAAQLETFYPKVKKHLRAPAYPGVSAHFFQLKRTSSNPSKRQETLGFIGKEWKRKGLDLAVDYFKATLKQRPELHFLVAGPAPEEVKHLFIDLPQSSYSLVGWMQSEAFMQQIDLLLHPARKEPFGMVIAEANAAGIRCLISDHCGIAPLLSADSGQILSLTDPTEQWQAAIIACLSSVFSVKKLDLTWQQLALQHCALYAEIAG